MNTPKIRIVFFISLAAIILVIAVLTYFYSSQLSSMRTSNVPSHLPLSANDTAAVRSIIDAKPIPLSGQLTSGDEASAGDIQGAVSQIITAEASTDQRSNTESAFLQGIVGSK